MTIIEKIKAEIERLKTVQLKRIQEGDLVDAEPYDKNEAYNGILSFLDTLESEKPMNQKGLEREIERCLWKLSDDPSNEELRMFARHFAKWGAEHLANSNDEIVINGHMVAYNKNKDAITMEEIPNELEEAARHSEILTYPMPEDGDIKKVFEVQEARVFHEIGFIAGAKWQKEQMMKEAVEGEVCIPNVWVEHKEGKELVVRAEISKELGFKFGDKVRVIVCKKEDKKDR